MKAFQFQKYVLFPGKWCPSRREWSSPPDVARRVYSSVFLGSPGEYPGMIVLITYIITLFPAHKQTTQFIPFPGRI